MAYTLYKVGITSHTSCIHMWIKWDRWLLLNLKRCRKKISDIMTFYRCNTFEIYITFLDVFLMMMLLRKSHKGKIEFRNIFFLGFVTFFLLASTWRGRLEPLREAPDLIGRSRTWKRSLSKTEKSFFKSSDHEYSRH